MKKFLFYLSFVGLVLTACSKDDEEESGGKLPPLPNPNDVCSGMDDADFIRYCYKNFDLNGDGAVSPSEAAVVHEISYVSTQYDRIYESYDSFAYFPNLEYLYFGIYDATIRTIDLSHNAKLNTLSISRGEVTSILLSDSITELMFYNSYNGSSRDLIRVLTIPANVKKLDIKASGLLTLYCKAVVPPTIDDSSSFGYYGLDFTYIQHIYVPESSVSQYKAAAGWKKYASVIQGHYK